MGLVKRCKALLLLILILSQVVLATGKEVHYLTLVDINTNKTKNSCFRHSYKKCIGFYYRYFIYKRWIYTDRFYI